MRLQEFRRGLRSARSIRLEMETDDKNRSIAGMERHSCWPETVSLYRDHKECPLRCPGCYAFDPAHLGGESELRELSDFKGDQLVTKILVIVDREKPLHLSLVGGDPLVRYREVELLLPQLEARGIHTQIVTSAFRVIPIEWNKLPRLNIVVSVDGLQADHDERRKPATYERILKNIARTKVTIHLLSPETLPLGLVIWRSFFSSGAIVGRPVKYG